jgi:hypothetical protein
MSDFITKDDYRAHIRTYKLGQILEEAGVDEDDILEDAESTSIAVVRDYLVGGGYDADAIFATNGNNRPKQVMRWVKCLVLYYIYERVPDDLVPERVVKDYDLTIDTLEKVSDGKMNVDLPSIQVPDGEDGTQAQTKFRWGSQPQRSHDPRYENPTKKRYW